MGKISLFGICIVLCIVVMEGCKTVYVNTTTSTRYTESDFNPNVGGQWVFAKTSGQKLTLYANNIPLYQSEFSVEFVESFSRGDTMVYENSSWSEFASSIKIQEEPTCPVDSISVSIPDCPFTIENICLQGLFENEEERIITFENNCAKIPTQVWVAGEWQLFAGETSLLTFPESANCYSIHCAKWNAVPWGWGTMMIVPQKLSVIKRDTFIVIEQPLNDLLGKWFAGKYVEHEP